MRLKRIELKNFKRFSDFPARFSPGINVVKGPLNEMGKSTLLEGIIVALFHNPKSTAQELKNYVSWGSTRQCQTILEFEDKENRYLLEKDFEKGTVRLVQDDGREELDTFKEISQKMAELLGTRSDDLFLSSCCIRQAQVSEISSGEKEISKSLEEVVTGGKESVLTSQIIQKLDARITEMKRGLDKLAKNPGTLASLNNELQDVTQKLHDVRDEVSRVEAQKLELVEANKQLAEIKEQYENARALLEKNKKRKEVEASIERLTKDYNSVEELLNRIKGHEEELKKAAEALGAIESFQDKQQVLEFRKRLDAIQNRRDGIENDLAAREKELVVAKENLDRRKSVRFLGSRKGLAASIAVLTGGIVGTLVGPLYLLSLIVLGAALLAATIRVRTSLIQDRIGISSTEERIRKMKESLGELSREERELLAEAKCNTVAEFNDKEKEFHRWCEMKERASIRLEGMLGGKSPVKSGIEDVEKQKSDIARKLAVEQANLTEDLIETRLSPEDYIELDRKVQKLEETRNALEDRRRDSMATIKAAKYDAEEQVRLEEKLENLRETLKREEKKLKVYELTRDFISRARTEVLSSTEEALEERIQKYLAVFTNGKYKQVKQARVDKEALEFWIYSDEKEDWVKPEELSGGVIDEFYLAFRLALAELIFGDKKPPLILDDPFVNFDSVRLDSTLNFFKTLSPDYQIIIFTLSDLYDKVADNIILLSEKEKLLW